MQTVTFDTFEEALEIPKEGIASRPLLEIRNGIKLVLFALDAGQEISSHRSPFPAEILLLKGNIEVLLGETWTAVKPNERIHLPMGLPHGVKAPEASHFMLTMLRDATH